jgi:tetratricopeptide (TPR) repeat protein
MKRAMFVVLLAGYLSSLIPPIQAQPANDPYAQQLKGQALTQFNEALRAEQAGDLNQAIEWCRKANSTYKSDKRVHFKEAQLAARLGNNEEAMREFRTTLNLDNNFVECRNEFACFYKFNKVDEKGAMNQWEQCVRINPKYPFPYYFMGQVYHDRGDLEGAINNFETYTRLRPESSDGWRELGLCIFERCQGDDIMSAQKALELSEKYAPENPIVHYHLGFIYATNGNLDTAEAQYRKALMCDARLAAAHWELARIRYLRGDLDRCQSEIAEALKINPTYTTEKKYPALKVPAMKTVNAQCIEFKGKLAQAIDAYLDLARVRGSDALYAAHIEDLKKKIKLIQKTLKKKPLTYDPEEIDALVSKGMEQYEDGDLTGAKASFERALELNPNSLEGMMNLCAVQEAEGDLNAASASNQKAIAINPAFDGAYYNYAYLLEKMNLPTDAGVMYDKFHKIAGKYPYDPQHVIKLQQDMIRQQRIEENKKSRGY